MLIGLDLEPGLNLDRVFGPNRYSTAVNVAREMGPSDVVYVASGEVFPDALAATPLAIRTDGPLVLTKANTVPDVTISVLDELSPTTVFVLGGSARISDEVVAQIGAETGATVTRIKGANRYGTAAEVATRWAPAEPDTVYVASGEMFADALSVGPLAGIEDDPVLLTAEDRLPPETAAALRRLAPERIVVLGGPARIQDSVVSDLQPYAGSVERLFGENRYETAALIAAEIAPGPLAYLASGQAFPDALSGGVLAGSTDSPVLLTQPDGLDSFAAQSLQTRDPATVRLLGGPAALAESVRDAVRALLGG